MRRLAQFCATRCSAVRFLSSTPYLMDVRYLTQEEATEVDVQLMDPDRYGYRVEQLMELAGLSVSQACFKSFPVGEYPRALVVVGPGNNGGDGLVCARHLSFYGYQPTIWRPIPPKKDLYIDLSKQCENLSIPIVSSLDVIDGDFDFIVDAIFGFSFKGTPRSPFDEVLSLINASQPPKLAVDIPSGWHVEEGKVNDFGVDADVLISLTAPKLCAKSFEGRHFLGGRFVPHQLQEDFQLKLPEYHDLDQVVELTS